MFFKWIYKNFKFIRPNLKIGEAIIFHPNLFMEIALIWEIKLDLVSRQGYTIKRIWVCGFNLKMFKKIFITGGGGYVGCALSDYLVKKGYEVTAFDLFLYSEDVFENNNKINLIKGDIRDLGLLESSIKNHDVVIHLACISNDPSFEMNQNLGNLSILMLLSLSSN